jgi:signal transduction histidine kinase
MKGSGKRRTYLIDKKFQLGFIFKFCLVVVISSILIGGILLGLSQNSTTVAIVDTKVVVKKTADFIFPIALQTIILVTIFSSLAVIILAGLVSHRIAGPLYRMRKEIDGLKEGDLCRNFTIRTKDQLQGLAQSLNDMGAVLKHRQSEIREKSNKIRLYLRQKEGLISGEEKKELEFLLNEMDKALEYFKV